MVIAPLHAGIAAGLAAVAALAASAPAQALRVLSIDVDDARRSALTEGLQGLATVASGSVEAARTGTGLDDYDAVVLPAPAEARLDRIDRDALSSYLRAGGSLVRIGPAEGDGTSPRKPAGDDGSRSGARGTVISVATDAEAEVLLAAVRRALVHALATPPANAISLIDPELSRWTDGIGRAPAWHVDDGVLTVVPGKGSIVTKRRFGDLRLHVEFAVPDQPDREGQQKGNSGVYLQRRYEVQILDSYGSEPEDDGAGAIYGRRAPDVNAAGPPDTWQSYDLWFRGARFDDEGHKTEDARLTLIHNGVLVQDDVAIAGKTGWGLPEGPSEQPLLLQDHGSPVRFRNLWLLPLE